MSWPFSTKEKVNEELRIKERDKLEIGQTKTSNDAAFPMNSSSYKVTVAIVVFHNCHVFQHCVVMCCPNHMN